MSHFTVLVIGDNPEEQLAPYHEFECTETPKKITKNMPMTYRVLSSLLRTGTDTNLATKIENMVTLKRMILVSSKSFVEQILTQSGIGIKLVVGGLVSSN
jgi:hypothetical protein